MKKETYSFKKDKYRSSRGGHSRLLSVCCRKCEQVVVVYQKDGPGNLRRLYMDRIFEPLKFTGLQSHEIKDIKPLKCGGCGELLGMPYVYQKEKRKAFRLFQDSVIKKIRKTIKQ